MQKIGSNINNLYFGIKKDCSKSQEQKFCAQYQVQNHAPMPVYTQIPYGINKRNYVKLGVEKLPNNQEMHIYRLSNGQNVEIIKKSQGIASICTHVKAGAMDEEGFPKGISHFIEHSVYHDSENYPDDIGKELEKITTYSNASTGINSTIYSLELVSDSIEEFKKALDIQSDMLLKPKFSKIEKEKSIVCAEYEDGLKNENKALYMKELSNLFPNTNERTFLVTGDNESINSITLDDMMRYHKKFYQPHNMNTVITTKCNPDEIIGIVANSFVSKSPKEQTLISRPSFQALNQTKRSDLISTSLTEQQVDFIFPCENIDEKEKIKIEALKQIFINNFATFLFFDKTHSANSRISYKFNLDDGATPNEVLSNFNQIIRQIASHPLSQNELEDIKKALKEDLDNTFNFNNLTKSEDYTELLSVDSNYVSYNTQLQFINSLTSQDILDSLKYLDLNRALISVVHSKDATQESILNEHKNSIPQIQNVIIPSNFGYYNYQFSEAQEQLSAQKYYSTTLNNQTNLVLTNSNKKDTMTVNWELNYGGNYSANPAVKYILDNLAKPTSFWGSTHFDTEESTGGSAEEKRDVINITAEIDLEDFQKDLDGLKNFNCFKINQETFEEAKKDALKDIKKINPDFYNLLTEATLGKQYCKDVEFLKQELEKLTINDVINELNNMILNSTSSVLVEAPIEQNSALANAIANCFDSSNFTFKPINSNIKRALDNSSYDCIIKADDDSQNTITQVYQFDTNGNFKDDVLLKLLSIILRSKNHDQIREQDGLAYYSGANFETFNNIGTIYLSTDSSCKNKSDIQKIQQDYNKNIAQLLNGEITQEELLLAKNRLKGWMYETTKFGPQFHSILRMPNALSSLAQTEKMIDEFSIEDIKSIANYAFKNKPKHVIIANQKVIDENMELFNTFGKIEKR